jgi:hypothetical protein
MMETSSSVWRVLSRNPTIQIRAIPRRLSKNDDVGVFPPASRPPDLYLLRAFLAQAIDSDTVLLRLGKNLDPFPEPLQGAALT